MCLHSFFDVYLGPWCCSAGALSFFDRVKRGGRFRAPQTFVRRASDIVGCTLMTIHLCTSVAVQVSAYQHVSRVPLSFFGSEVFETHLPPQDARLYVHTPLRPCVTMNTPPPPPSVTRKQNFLPYVPCHDSR